MNVSTALLIAQVRTPLPVSVRAQTPLPVSVRAQTPLPVIVRPGTRIPVDTGGADWATLLTIALAAIAALYAILSYNAIKQQLVLARDQLDLARKELIAVEEDLKNNRAQMAEFLRRPSLHLRGAVTVRRATDFNPRQLEVTLYVSNDGDRPVEHHLLEFLIPLEKGIGYAAAPMDPNYRMVNGVAYYVVPLFSPNDRVLFPNGVPMDYHPVIPVKPEVVEVCCLYRLFDNYGKYPDKGYGTFRMPTNKPMYDVEPEAGPDE